MKYPCIYSLLVLRAMRDVLFFCVLYYMKHFFILIFNISKKCWRAFWYKFLERGDIDVSKTMGHKLNFTFDYRLTTIADRKKYTRSRKHFSLRFENFFFFFLRRVTPFFYSLLSGESFLVSSTKRRQKFKPNSSHSCWPCQQFNDGRQNFYAPKVRTRIRNHYAQFQNLQL